MQKATKHTVENKIYVDPGKFMENTLENAKFITNLAKHVDAKTQTEIGPIFSIIRVLSINQVL